MADAPSISKVDIWQTIPPEEKLELMARAQAAGVFACIIAVIIASTVAVSLKLDWIMWGSFLACPFIFQFAAGKKWRDLRPRTMLEYLAARSAARRYAFMNHSKNLGLQLLFKGQLAQRFEKDQIQEALEAAVAARGGPRNVWIALFNDAIVMMSEQPGGAEVDFAHLINERLTMEAIGGDDQKQGYSSGREIVLRSLDRNGVASTSWVVTSRYPAALVVFEKKLQALMAQVPGGTGIPTGVAEPVGDFGGEMSSGGFEDESSALSFN